VGQYSTGVDKNASEAIRDALRVLQQKRREDALRERALPAQIKAGPDALERGDFTEVAEAELTLRVGTAIFS
jgi:antitoxin ParD1/3/4